jgi:hypothetical protein
MRDSEVVNHASSRCTVVLRSKKKIYLCVLTRAIVIRSAAVVIKRGCCCVELSLTPIFFNEMAVLKLKKDAVLLTGVTLHNG